MIYAATKHISQAHGIGVLLFALILFGLILFMIGKGKGE